MYDDDYDYDNEENEEESERDLDGYIEVSCFTCAKTRFDREDRNQYCEEDNKILLCDNLPCQRWVPAQECIKASLKKTQDKVKQLSIYNTMRDHFIYELEKIPESTLLVNGKDSGVTHLSSINGGDDITNKVQTDEKHISLIFGAEGNQVGMTSHVDTQCYHIWANIPLDANGCVLPSKLNVTYKNLNSENVITTTDKNEFMDLIKTI